VAPTHGQRQRARQLGLADRPQQRDGANDEHDEEEAREYEDGKGTGG
jgi:hypothetical protein